VVVETGSGAGSEAEPESEVDGAGSEGETVTGGAPGVVAEPVGSGVVPEPWPAVVPPPVPVPVPLPVPVLPLPVPALVPVLPVPVPGSVLEPLAGRSGEVGTGSGSDPDWTAVSTEPAEPTGSSA
jgi:hypothetical protein